MTDPARELKLTRWERYYLEHARHFIVRIPKDSKVADSLIEKGMIYGVGLVVGRYVEYQMRYEGLAYTAPGPASP